MTMESTGVLWRVWGQEGAGYWSGQTARKRPVEQRVDMRDGGRPRREQWLLTGGKGRHRESWLWSVGMRTGYVPLRDVCLGFTFHFMYMGVLPTCMSVYMSDALEAREALDL